MLPRKWLGTIQSDISGCTLYEFQPDDVRVILSGKSRKMVREMKEMQYTNHYESPMGGILLAADMTGLTGLWFDGQKYFANHLDLEHEEKNLPVFREVKRWLEIYFSGQEPDFMPPLHVYGSPFQLAVWEILQKIPYGETTTYGEIAKIIAKQRGLSHMSAQAVGGAVGHNKISIIIPCHRVMGANGSLTGYAGGIDKKVKLLELEKGGMRYSFVPKKRASHA